MEISVLVRGTRVPIDAAVFEALFSNSVVGYRAGIARALNRLEIPMKDFLELSRRAEVPYPLLFAPLPVVQQQLAIKNSKLMAGFTRSSFSMHSRHRVELSDVELIVKDLIRKQQILRTYDKTLANNRIVGLLKNSKLSVVEDASKLMAAIDLDHGDLRAAKNRDDALETLIGKLESNQVFVSRSAKNHMPQTMPPDAKFSGMTVKDKKVPFIFLATGGEGEHLEPAGRKLFTLTLLTVLVARDVFAPVNYDGHTKDDSSPREYEITAEILMPAKDFGASRITGLETIKELADEYRVTPSAVAMRAWRLGLVGRADFGAYMATLKDEYSARTDPPRRSAKPINAAKKYNGLECSRRMLRLLDAGKITASDFRRVMFSNKIPTSQIAAFRDSVR